MNRTIERINASDNPEHSFASAREVLAKFTQIKLTNLKRAWDNCTLCPLGLRAFKHCQYDIIGDEWPIHIVAIGEGPGEAEDVIGKPFSGPSGNLLRACIADTNIPINILLTNLVACRPQDSKNGHNRQPNDEEICACRPRLKSILDYTQPVAILCLGRIAHDNISASIEGTYWEEDHGIDSLEDIYHLIHPAAIVRSNDKRREIKEYTEKLRNTFQTIIKTSQINHLMEYV